MSKKIKTPKAVDYSIAYDKLDKFMHEDLDGYDDYYDIIERRDLSEMVEYINNNMADESRFYSYAKGGTIEGFAQYILDQG